jgi:hypothetical protein
MANVALTEGIIMSSILRYTGQPHAYGHPEKNFASVDPLTAAHFANFVQYIGRAINRERLAINRV